MAIDHHIKFDGVDGEAAHKDHKGEIELLSWNWSVTNASNIAGGGSGQATRRTATPRPRRQASSSTSGRPNSTSERTSTLPAHSAPDAVQRARGGEAVRDARRESSESANLPSTRIDGESTDARD